jgi:hypothetical protein
MTRLTATRATGSTRTTALRRQQRMPVSTPLPIPTGGLDAVSPLTSMPPDRAIVLDNFFPRLKDIELRRGHAAHCDTGETGEAIESLMVYNAPVGSSDRMFAAVAGNIEDVTTSTPSESITGLSNNRWQHINFSTSGGNFLVMCNGANGVRYYDGSAWATSTITGVTAADLIHICGFKNRIWFVEKESSDAWFLPPDSIQGAASRFPLGGVFQEGGFLMAIATWALDGGDGPDDRIAFISSEGEVAIYAGADPTNAASWSLQGVYKVGAPIGRRCTLKIGGDVAIICVDGVVPLSKAMVVERGSALTVAITANIQPLLNAAAKDFRDIFGWELCSYPLGTMAILNVPQLLNETAIQYVMNTVSGAWCRFTGWNANCFAVFQEELYFGGNDGVVYQADTSGADNGEPIVGEVQTAFNDGSNPMLKIWCLVRPFIITDGDVQPGIAVNVDYRNDAQVETSPAVLPDAAEWDIAEWDVDVWPIEENLVAEWQEVGAVAGNVASIKMQVAAQGAGSDVILRLIALQIAYIPGGLI